MNRVRLPGWSGPVLKAAIWLRKHKNIPDYESVEQAFAEYFNCNIIRIREADPDYLSKGIAYVYAEFDARDATMFILRWS